MAAERSASNAHMLRNLHAYGLILRQVPGPRLQIRRGFTSNLLGMITRVTSGTTGIAVQVKSFQNAINAAYISFLKNYLSEQVKTCHNASAKNGKDCRAGVSSGRLRTGM